MNPTLYPPRRQHGRRRSPNKAVDASFITPLNPFSRPTIPGKLWEPPKTYGPRHPRHLHQVPPLTSQIQTQCHKPIQQLRSPPFDDQKRLYSHQKSTAADGNISLSENRRTGQSVEQSKVSMFQSSQGQSQQYKPICQIPKPQELKHPVKPSDEELDFIIAARKARMKCILADWDTTWDNASAEESRQEPSNLDEIPLSDQPSISAICEVLRNIRVIPPKDSYHGIVKGYKQELNLFTIATPGSHKPAPCLPKACPLPKNDLNYSSDADNGGVVLMKLRKRDILNEEDEEPTCPHPTAAIQFAQLKAKIPWLSKQRTIHGAGWRPFGDYYWDGSSTGMEQTGRSSPQTP